MTPEWIVIGLLLGWIVVAWGRHLRSGRAWILLALVYGSAMAGARWWETQARNREQLGHERTEKVPQPARSRGYVSSDACRACHPSQYASWHRSFHRTMTQLPSSESVRGEFSGVTLDLNGEKFYLQRCGQDFCVEMVDPDWKQVQRLRRAKGLPEEPNPPRTLKRISMVTGSHHMQAYWTVSEFGNMQFSFPFTFLFEEQRWVQRNEVFLMDPRLPFNQQVWNVNCLNCHATAGQPRQDTNTSVMTSRVAELGIACEACHGPAEEHLRLNRDPARRYQLHRSGRADPSIFNPARTDHVKSAEACGQCHAIRSRDERQQEQWNREGSPFRPGDDIEAHYPLLHHDASQIGPAAPQQARALMEGSFWSDGQVRVSGREFHALSESGCYRRGSISCVSCHSMHQYLDTDDQLAARMDGNQACVQCHGTLAAKLEQHTHHASGSSGSLCYNCHMPFTTYGLVKAIRSHLINSPTAQSSLATGRPNACNLCHLDRTLDWTARQLHEWYRQPIPVLGEEQKDTAAALAWALRGDAGQRAILAWHMGWEPARRVSGEDWLAPYLAELLVDPYAVVRLIAQRSLKRLPGYETFPYDYIAPSAERAAARKRALEIWRSQPPAAHSDARLLLRPDGTRDETKTATLLHLRDDHPIYLLE